MPGEYPVLLFMDDQLKFQNQRYKFIVSQAADPLAAIQGLNESFLNDADLKVQYGLHDVVDVFVISTAKIGQISQRPEPLFVAVAVLKKMHELRPVRGASLHE